MDKKNMNEIYNESFEINGWSVHIDFKPNYFSNK